jgi:hypothetical protein
MTVLILPSADGRQVAALAKADRSFSSCITQRLIIGMKKRRIMRHLTAEELSSFYQIIRRRPDSVRGFYSAGFSIEFCEVNINTALALIASGLGSKVS